MRTRQVFILLGLLIGLAGCCVQSKLSREYKGKTHEDLMLGLGRPTSVEPLSGGRKIEIYQKSKFLKPAPINTCLLYTSDAADDLLCVDLGGRRIIKKK